MPQPPHLRLSPFHTPICHVILLCFYEITFCKHLLITAKEGKACVWLIFLLFILKLLEDIHMFLASQGNCPQAPSSRSAWDGADPVWWGSGLCQAFLASKLDL